MLRSIWRVVYPALLLTGIYFLVYFCAVFAWTGFFASSYPTLEDFMAASQDLISVFALLAGFVIIYIFYRRESVPADPFLSENKLYYLLIALLGIFACVGLDILVSAAYGLISPGAADAGTDTAALSAGASVLLVFKSVILAPLAEEFTFRGLCFGRMMGYLTSRRSREGEFGSGFWLSALVSSLLFGLYHFNLIQGIYAFLCGFLMCAVYHKFKNICACILLHACANAAVLALSFTGVLAGLPLWLFAVIMFVCFGAAAFIWLRVLNRAL